MPKLAFISRLLGDSNEKELKRIQPLINTINDLGPELAALPDEALFAKSAEFKQRLGEGETLDDLLPEAFAVARETSSRRVGQRPFDVQLMGGIVLHSGRIAEMRTGEGKTLTAVAPIYLNALAGRGVHLVTVNDYLARRDAAWYGPIYHALGLSVGVIQNNTVTFVYEPGFRPGDEGSAGGGYMDLRPAHRTEAYACDITYGTNNEFGFDYLRDNMVREAESRVQRPLAYAIVDEVDNILIDEARTPLIISGAAEEASQTYAAFARAARTLVEDRDYIVDHKAKHVALTEEGIERMEKTLGIDNIYGGDPRMARHLDGALDAEVLKRIDRDYVVKDGEIIIVDEFTGRLMPGRRWSHGIHQAVEAKEGLKVQRESITYATITFQNLFRLYEKLAGMTGTAETEAEEFAKIYDLDVVVIPTHRPMVRQDDADIIYINERAKFNAVVNEIEAMHQQGRPVLVGTTSIEKSEYLAQLLLRKGIPHEVLNAKQHEREAKIVEFAGEEGAVTIATNMAGRGTDIKLGAGVAEKGGLHVIGTERHESRRIDNQLRGRTGRQGDPGSSRFFVSFDDDIMKRFAPDWLPSMMAKLGLEDDYPLESSMVTRAIATAQTKVESYNFDIRKNVVEYDDVMNNQRDMIYGERDRVLANESMRETIMRMVEEEIESTAATFLDREAYDPASFISTLDAIVPLEGELTVEQVESMTVDEVVDAASDLAEERYDALEDAAGEPIQRLLERMVVLQTIDQLWVQHLTAMDEMRQGIGLRAYGQADPLVAYKREAHDMWDQFLENLRSAVARQIFHARIASGTPAPTPPATPEAALPRNARESGPSLDDASEPVSRASSVATAVRKVGRNELCPCGSGKKYKRCHGS